MEVKGTERQTARAAGSFAVGWRCWRAPGISFTARRRRSFVPSPTTFSSDNAQLLCNSRRYAAFETLYEYRLSRMSDVPVRPLPPPPPLPAGWTEHKAPSGMPFVALPQPYVIALLTVYRSYLLLPQRNEEVYLHASRRDCNPSSSARARRNSSSSTSGQSACTSIRITRRRLGL